jgi:hypothetical protein
MLLFTGGSFPKLVRKRRCAVTTDCVRAHSSTQNAFSARVAIFTQPAPLACTDVTTHQRHVQTNLESFSFYRYVACYHPLRHSSVPIFCNVSGNYEKPVLDMTQTKIMPIDFTEWSHKICEISSSHGGEYEVQNCLLGCTAV